MFKLFLRVLLAFLALIGVFLLIGSLLPRGYDVETTVVINAPPQEVFPWVNELRKWEEWSPISSSRFEGLKANYSGEAQGVGAIQTWTESRGEGKMWIVESNPPELITYGWRFAGFPELKGDFVFESVAAQGDDNTDKESQACRVTWKSKGRLPGGPFYGYLAFIFESGLEFEYQKSLDLLKAKVEEAK